MREHEEILLLLKRLKIRTRPWTTADNTHLWLRRHIRFKEEGCLGGGGAPAGAPSANAAYDYCLHIGFRDGFVQADPFKGVVASVLEMGIRKEWELRSRSNHAGTRTSRSIVYNVEPAPATAGMLRTSSTTGRWSSSRLRIDPEALRCVVREFVAEASVEQKHIDGRTAHRRTPVSARPEASGTTNSTSTEHFDAVFETMNSWVWDHYDGYAPVGRSGLSLQEEGRATLELFVSPQARQRVGGPRPDEPRRDEIKSVRGRFSYEKSAKNRSYSCSKRTAPDSETQRNAVPPSTTPPARSGESSPPTTTNASVYLLTAAEVRSLFHRHIDDLAFFQEGHKTFCEPCLRQFQDARHDSFPYWSVELAVAERVVRMDHYAKEMEKAHIIIEKGEHSSPKLSTVLEHQDALKNQKRKLAVLRQDALQNQQQLTKETEKKYREKMERDERFRKIATELAEEWLVKEELFRETDLAKGWSTRSYVNALLQKAGQRKSERAAKIMERWGFRRGAGVEATTDHTVLVDNEQNLDGLKLLPNFRWFPDCLASCMEFVKPARINELFAENNPELLPPWKTLSLSETAVLAEWAKVRGGAEFVVPAEQLVLEQEETSSTASLVLEQSGPPRRGQ